MPTDPAPLPHPFFRPEHRRSIYRILPSELRTLLEGNERPILLDVRSAGERRNGHLPGDLHIPLSFLPDRLSELSRDRTIVTYDHYGSEAARAAELLETRGFLRVAALEGGLDEYSLRADPTLPRYRTEGTNSGLYIHALPRPATGCLSYLIGDLTSRDAIMIDPGTEVDRYLAHLKEGAWRLGAIVETHTHADHLAGHAALHARTGAPICVSRRSPALYPHRPLAEGEAIPLGGEELQVIETPGHTRDHLTLKVSGTVFTGDTLLIGSCGRTDLGDGSPDLLFESLTDKLLRLPNETEVCPAHYGAHHALGDRWSSSIGIERATNEALQQKDREAFIRYMTEGWPPKPANFDAIVRANLAP